MPSRQSHRRYYADAPRPQPAAKPADRPTLCINCAHRFDVTFQCPTTAKAMKRGGLFVVLECEGFKQAEAELHPEAPEAIRM